MFPGTWQSFVAPPQMENHSGMELSKLKALWEALEGGKRDSKSWPTYLELDLEF